MPGRLPQYVSDAFLPHPPKTMGVAVSGGSDSLALLHLLNDFCSAQKVNLHAVTVNHGLRSGAADEAEIVAKQCAGIGVSHDTILWEDWSGQGNLQHEAREARYSKMASWARQRSIDTIAVGHTADDQAETVLMRLARRSGVDGLSGMKDRTVRDGITWVRPLLRSRRDILKSYLQGRGIPWVNDPSNDDEGFERIKMRRVLNLLEPLGIDAEVLSDVADHMLQARKALDWQTFLAAKHIVTLQAGAVVLDETMLRLQPEEIQRRLVVKAINWVSSTDYTPRMQTVSRLMAGLRKGQAGTVDGCHIRRIAACIWIFRELNAVARHETPTTMLWDNRWRLLPQSPEAHRPDLKVRPLGMDGLEQCPEWRATGLPHVVLQSTPAIWKDSSLVAAPLAGLDDNWKSDVIGGSDTFFAALLSH